MREVMLVSEQINGRSWLCLSGLAVLASMLLACSTPPAQAQRAGTGLTYHLSDCQTGAAPGCTAGDNANPGTPAAPKRDLRSFNLATMPAGTTFLFARGGAWAPGMIKFENANSSAAAPITFADYGTGPLPLLRVSGGNLFEFSKWRSTLNDGGYVLRNLKLDGGGTAQWAISLADQVHDIIIDGLEITGFAIGIHMISGVDRLTVRNSHVHRNLLHGFLGKANNATFEGNLIERNNPDGGGREHGMYLSGGNNIVVRNNRFLQNSVDASGRCTGGNFTLHGQTDGLLIEGNHVEVDDADGGCYGFSITPGYFEPEWFRNVVVRGNTVVNVGNCSVCAGAAPGIVIENNRFYKLRPGFQIAVTIPAHVGGETSVGDDLDRDPIVRNNLVCLSAPADGSGAVRAAVPGAQVVANVYRRGNEATTGACAR